MAEEQNGLVTTGEGQRRSRGSHDQAPGHVLLIGLNRPEKYNAFNLALINQLAQAYHRLENDPEVSCGVLYGRGKHFTSGLDLAQVGPEIARGALDFHRPGRRDPWRRDGPWLTPLVMAVHGLVMTLAIELALAADIRIASSDARFSQLEINRGIYAFGGATARLPRDCGWGNAMRWLLAGEEYDATEALRIGLVQEVVAPDAQLDRALDIARRISDRSAPLGVRATPASAHLARGGERAAFEILNQEVLRLLDSTEGQECLRSCVERRDARFIGR